MIFLTGYFEVCLSEIKERSLNSWFLTVFFFLYPCGTNKICKTCSVTQIRGGRMRIGRDGSWQQATTGFEQKSDCCSGTKWLIRQKEIGSEKARNAILLWQQLLDCQFPEEHKPTKSNLDFGIIPKERNLVEFHVILSGFHWPKNYVSAFFSTTFWTDKRIPICSGTRAHLLSPDIGPSSSCCALSLSVSFEGSWEGWEWLGDGSLINHYHSLLLMCVIIYGHERLGNLFYGSGMSQLPMLAFSEILQRWSNDWLVWIATVPFLSWSTKG